MPKVRKSCFGSMQTLPMVAKEKTLGCSGKDSDKPKLDWVCKDEFNATMAAHPPSTKGEIDGMKK